MTRRELLILLGGATLIRPLTVLGQEKSVPVIGFLSIASEDTFVPFVSAFEEGLRDAGYVKDTSTGGRTVTWKSCPPWHPNSLPERWM